MPLGGLDTGCLDIEANGMLGYSTLFNHLIYPRLLYNVPFLGISVDGKSCVLATDTQGKLDRPVERETGTFPPLDYTPAFFDTGTERVTLAKSIDYFGHYPILDMEYQTDLPVSVGVRAWSPMLPGDTKTSMMPGLIIEVSLRNPDRQTHRGTIALSFPGFESPHEQTGIPHKRQSIEKNMQGVVVSSLEQDGARQLSYVLACLGQEGVRKGGRPPHAARAQRALSFE